jgi:hypothetical protein
MRLDLGFRTNFSSKARPSSILGPPKWAPPDQVAIGIVSTRRESALLAMYRIPPRTLRHRGNAYGLSMAALARERWQAKTPICKTAFGVTLRQSGGRTIVSYPPLPTGKKLGWQRV